MEDEDNGTDFDRDSGGLEESCGEQDNGSDYSYHEDHEDGDDDNYAYEDDDRVDTYVKSYIGMQFDGNMHAMMQAPGKSSLYPVYKQLSEICLVDISPDFYSALLTIGVKDQVIMLTIKFPEKEPFFPNAPPRLELQSKFLYPNEKFNILFNCHPQLLGTQWNFCTDIVQIVRDLIQVAETSVVDTLDEDFDAGTGVQRKIIKMLHQNGLDVTSLFPDSQKNKLPSFGILRETVASTSTSTRPRGVGYSSSGHGDAASAKWDVTAHTTAKLDGLLELTRKVQEDIKKAESRGAQIDPIMVDAVYFIFSHTVSRTVTMEEFFRHLSFYDMVIECLLPLPPPSEHIAPVQSLLKLYQSITSGRLSDSLEPAELVVLGKLRVLNERLQRSALAASATSSSADCKASPRGSQAKDTEDSGPRAMSAGGSKKRHLSGGADAKQHASDTEAATYKESSCSSSSAGVGGMLSVTAIPRVVELEDAFVSHKYASDMKGVAHMNAKWLRRMNMELGTMPESLPDNVIVFSGMQCSQPNMMKILMFPESPDTPYCGGCFVFDAFVPTDYPSNPPKVNIITTGSGSVRFNPNLYNCGKVCLSLLGTWSGEKWNPEVSSLSQVINSILFLIFVEHPYFNEPGYQSTQGTPNGDKQSEEYNKVIRTATLQYGYLDHFRKPNAQLKRYILPMLCHTWRSKGHAAALQWAATQPSLQTHIDAIESEVSKLVGAAPAPVLPAAAVSGEKASSSSAASAGAK